MKSIRAPIKAIIFIVIVIFYFIFAFYFKLTVSNKVLRRKKFAENSHRICKLVVKLFDIKVVSHNLPHKEQEGLIVGNHMGFIDIICLLSQQPCVFITSLEMKKTPGLGWITEMAGCAYVDRKNRMKIEDELQDIVKILKQGVKVVLYPEAQATNGEQVLPFKKTLLMSAVLAQKPVIPYVINFVEVEGRPVAYKDRDSLCWYGDLSFLTSIMGALGFSSIKAEIKFFEPILFEENSDRTYVAETLHQMISYEFKPFKPNE